MNKQFTISPVSTVECQLKFKNLCRVSKLGVVRQKSHINIKRVEGCYQNNFEGHARFASPRALSPHRWYSCAPNRFTFSFHTVAKSLKCNYRIQFRFLCMVCSYITHLHGGLQSLRHDNLSLL